MKRKSKNRLHLSMSKEQAWGETPSKAPAIQSIHYAQNLITPAEDVKPINVRRYTVLELPEEEGRKFEVGKTMRLEKTETLLDGTKKTIAQSLRIMKQEFHDGMCRLELNTIMVYA